MQKDRGMTRLIWSLCLVVGLPVQLSAQEAPAGSCYFEGNVFSDGAVTFRAPSREVGGDSLAVICNGGTWQAASGRPCYYNSELYSNGARLNQPGGNFLCDNGSWQSR